jgi:YidC/Oxa1 family membrane protein insertase
MDKNSIVGYLLIFLIFAGYLVYSSKDASELQKEQQQWDSIEQAQRLLEPQDKSEPYATKEDLPADLLAIDHDEDASQISPTAEILPEETFTLENDQVLLEFSSKGGKVNSVQLKDYLRYDSADLLLFDKTGNRFSYTIPLKTGVVETADLDFEVKEQDANHILLVHEFPGGGSIGQSYSFNENYLIDYHLQINDLEERIARKHSTLDLNWELTSMLQERSLEDERNLTTIYYKYRSDDDVDNLSERKYEDKSLQANVHWVSYKQKFFMSTLIFPEGLDESGTTIETVEVQSDTQVQHFSSSFSIPYNFSKSENQHFQFYYGPNHYQTLKKHGIKLEKSVALGWGIIGWVNKYLIIPVFNWLSQFFSSYGLIILLLTIMIKGLLILPMYKIYVSSAKMKLLKPELDELKVKTGGDMQKMQQEQMKLYKKAGVSPFGGCLPQLIQFPILIAMFRFFPSSIELRQKSFLWANDLSTYDSIYTFPNNFSVPMYGDHISLFTILMALSSLLYTLYNSQSTGLSGQMKYIMYLMPVMLLVWFNSYSSGLSYYYFLANIITFGQNFIFKTFIVDEDKLHKQMQANKNKKGAGTKKSKFQKKLEEMAKKRGVDPKTGRK